MIVYQPFEFIRISYKDLTHYKEIMDQIEAMETGWC